MTRHTTFRSAWLVFCLVATALVLRMAYSRLHRPSGEELNRFTDARHFADHALLAESLAGPLTDLLSQMPPRSQGPKSR